VAVQSPQSKSFERCFGKFGTLDLVSLACFPSDSTFGFHMRLSRDFLPSGLCLVLTWPLRDRHRQPLVAISWNLLEVDCPDGNFDE
jgi:hypothetical protein